MTNSPYILTFQKIGAFTEGFISVAQEGEQFSFETKRCFWTYGTPSNLTRGRHAHYESEMILIAISGNIIVDTIDYQGRVEQFELNDPNTGLYLPKLCWHEMKYSQDAVQLVLCSTLYHESDYIRSFEVFRNLTLQNAE